MKICNKKGEYLELILGEEDHFTVLKMKCLFINMNLIQLISL